MAKTRALLAAGFCFGPHGVDEPEEPMAEGLTEPTEEEEPATVKCAGEFLDMKDAELFDVFAASSVGVGGRKCRIFECSNKQCTSPFFVLVGQSDSHDDKHWSSQDSSWVSSEGSDGSADTEQGAVNLLRELLRANLCFGEPCMSA